MGNSSCVLERERCSWDDDVLRVERDCPWVVGDDFTRLVDDSLFTVTEESEDPFDRFLVFRLFRSSPYFCEMSLFLSLALV